MQLQTLFALPEVFAEFFGAFAYFFGGFFGAVDYFAGGFAYCFSGFAGLVFFAEGGCGQKQRHYYGYKQFFHVCALEGSSGGLTRIK